MRTCSHIGRAPVSLLFGDVGQENMRAHPLTHSLCFGLLYGSTFADDLDRFVSAGTPSKQRADLCRALADVPFSP